MRRDDPGGPSAGRVRLAGEITAPGAVCDVFAMLAQMGWRGELSLTDLGVRRSLFFDGGNVLGAQTSVERERLGAVMYRYGAIGEEELERVIEATGGARFGKVAVDLELVSQSDVFRCLRHQIEEVAYAAFAQTNGTFVFLEGFDASRLVSHHVLPAPQLVMDGVTRMDEIRYFREKVPSADYVPARGKGGDPVAAEYQETLDAVDGLRSIEELGRVTGRGEFAITKDVYGLERSGHVVIHPPRRSSDSRQVVELTNALLTAIHSEADQANRGHELRRSLKGFAAGNGVYDVLFHKAGPGPDGSLVAQRVAANLLRLTAGGTEANLRRVLYEYVSFAIFSVGATLGWQRESALGARLAAPLKDLEPR
jgi:hypothetical protein